MSASALAPPPFEGLQQLLESVVIDPTLTSRLGGNAPSTPTATIDPACNRFGWSGTPDSGALVCNRSVMAALSPGGQAQHRQIPGGTGVRSAAATVVAASMMALIVSLVTIETTGPTPPPQRHPAGPQISVFCVSDGFEWTSQEGW